MLCAHINLAVIYINEMRLDEAIAELEKASKILPSQVAAYINLAHVYAVKGQMEEGRGLAQKGLDYAPIPICFTNSWGASASPRKRCKRLVGILNRPCVSTRTMARRSTLGVNQPAKGERRSLKGN